MDRRTGSLRWADRRRAAVIGLASTAVAAVIGVGLFAFNAWNTPATPPAVTIGPSDVAHSGVLRVGVMRSGGIWAIRGSEFLTSPNGGDWRPRQLPRDAIGLLTGQTIHVHDPDHAWVLLGNLNVARTADGGASWQTAVLEGGCSALIGISFADASTGYVACVNGGGGSDTVFRSTDGGASWSSVSKAARSDAGWLGTHLAASDPDTLWAWATSQDTGTQALLAVSRDRGATWADVPLSGIDPHYRGPSDTIVMGIAFFGARGIVAVRGATNDPAGPIHIYSSTDGHQWVPAGGHPTPRMCLASPRLVPTNGWC